MQLVVTVAQDAVPRALIGSATSAVNLVRELGATIGMAVIGTALAARNLDFGDPSRARFWRLLYQLRFRRVKRTPDPLPTYPWVTFPASWARRVIQDAGPRRVPGR